MELGLAINLVILWSKMVKNSLVSWVFNFGCPSCGVAMEYCGVSMDNCGMSLEDCGMPLEDCGVSMEDCGMSLEDCSLSLLDRMGSSIGRDP